MAAVDGDDEDEALQRCIRRLTALVKSSAVKKQVVLDAESVVDIAALLDALAAERARRVRTENALVSTLDRAERFEAQAAEHWLRLARCRGILCDVEATDEEREDVLKATATDDAPSNDAIERARIRLDDTRTSMVLAKMMLGMAYDYFAGHLPYNANVDRVRSYVYDVALDKLWHQMNHHERNAAGPLETVREV